MGALAVARALGEVDGDDKERRFPALPTVLEDDRICAGGRPNLWGTLESMTPSPSPSEVEEMPMDDDEGGSLASPSPPPAAAAVPGEVDATVDGTAW